MPGGNAGGARSIPRGMLSFNEDQRYASEQRSHTIHSPGDFTGLLVAPTNRCKVGLVVHESAVEVGFNVRVSALDVDLTRELAIIPRNAE
jgi:hypothetical protein